MSDLPGTGRLSGAAARTAAPAVLLLALASCATMAPERTEPREPASSWFGMLPEDGTFYLAADVDSSREMLVRLLGEAGVPERSYRDLLERTSRVYASVHLRPEAQAGFSAVALGRYPRKPTNFYLWTRKEWRRERSSFLYWVHRGQNLQVTVPRDGLILATSGEVEGLAGRLASARPLPLPEGADRDLETAPVAFYFPDLPPAVRQTWGARLPIREVWLAVREREQRYELNGVFRLWEARNPRLTEGLFRLLILVWLRGAQVGNLSERLESVRVSATPEAVRVSGLLFTLEELTRSLETFTGVAAGD